MGNNTLLGDSDFGYSYSFMNEEKNLVVMLGTVDSKKAALVVADTTCSIEEFRKVVLDIDCSKKEFLIDFKAKHLYGGPDFFSVLWCCEWSKEKLTGCYRDIKSVLVSDKNNSNTIIFEDMEKDGDSKRKIVYRFDNYDLEMQEYSAPRWLTKELENEELEFINADVKVIDNRIFMKRKYAVELKE